MSLDQDLAVLVEGVNAIIRKGVVIAKFMCATLSTLRTGCMAQSGRAAGGIAAAKLALTGAEWRESYVA